MTKKNASLVSIICLFVYGVFSFMPCIVTETYWKADNPGVGIYGRGWSDTQGLFEEPTSFLAIVLLILAIIGIAAMVCQYAGKEMPYLKYASFAPAAMIAVFAILSITVMFATMPNGNPAGTATLGYYGYFEYSMAWGYYIAAALLIVGGALGTLVALGKVEEEKPVEKSYQPTMQILQLKELLDAGAITQEEYEQKKKELLGL